MSEKQSFQNAWTCQIFTYLGAANITSKQNSDMTKIAIKNENITSFGGIYHMMDVFIRSKHQCSKFKSRSSKVILPCRICRDSEGLSFLKYFYHIYCICSEIKVHLLFINSHPLKTIFQHKACTDKLYADSFYKVQKNSYSSFEVICCRG